MELAKLPSVSRTLLWITGACILGVFLNLLFLFLIQNSTRNISLLRKELAALEQNQRIIQTAQEVYRAHEEDVALLSGVFPTETSLPEFLTELENVLSGLLSGYTVKFNSIQPIPEAEKLYLLMTINGKGAGDKLDELLLNLEKLPYMTHVVSLQGKTVNGLTGVGDIAMSLKVYVQNPFTNK